MVCLAKIGPRDETEKKHTLLSRSLADSRSFIIMIFVDAAKEADVKTKEARDQRCAYKCITSIVLV